MFQSTHPHGVRPKWQGGTQRRKQGFNPRTHTGCDICHRSIRTIRCCFNPRTHTGCDLKPSRRLLQPRQFQSTHPHGVRRLDCTADIIGRLVSIHAPTRGATFSSLLFFKQKKVSIHAPTRGATQSFSSRAMGQRSFNPRTHTGCDNRLQGLSINSKVSIHAPTRGAALQNSLIQR